MPRPKSIAVLDMAGYGPVFDYTKLQSLLVNAHHHDPVRALVQILALARERAVVDAGGAAVAAAPNAAALSAGAEMLREVMADVHRLINGQDVPWLKALTQPQARKEPAA